MPDEPFQNQVFEVWVALAADHRRINRRANPHHAITYTEARTPLVHVEYGTVNVPTLACTCGWAMFLGDNGTPRKWRYVMLPGAKRRLLHYINTEEPYITPWYDRVMDALRRWFVSPPDVLLDIIPRDHAESSILVTHRHNADRDLADRYNRHLRKLASTGTTSPPNAIVEEPPKGVVGPTSVYRQAKDGGL